MNYNNFNDTGTMMKLVKRPYLGIVFKAAGIMSENIGMCKNCAFLYDIMRHFEYF